jgi:septal ring factor EnvC (AmiA/AmiB activator)
MRYAMGATHSRIDNSVMQATREVRLTFEANGKLVSTTRGFQHPNGKFPVVVEDQPTRLLDPDEMGEFLLYLLDIPRVRYQSGERARLLSFNDLARACVVDRDFSYTEILSKVIPEQRREVIKLMLGLTTQEIADVEEQIRDAELQLQRLNAEIRGVERLLADFRVGTLIEIEERRGNVQLQLTEIQDQENTLRARIEQVSSDALPEQSYKAEGYAALRQELIGVRERLNAVQGDLAVLARQVQEKTDLRELLESEVRKLERHTSSQYVLATFTFSHCPRCLRPIEAEMRERERSGDCMLCGRELQSEEQFDSNAWRKAVDDANKAVAEANQLINYYSDRIEGLQAEEKGIQQRIGWLEAELSRQTAHYVSPLVEDLSILSARRADALRALSQLELEENQRRYVDKLYGEELPALRRNRDELLGRLAELQLLRGRPSERIEAFLRHFHNFMRATASPQYRFSSWDAAEFLPMINEQPHTRALTGFDLAISVLAFHYALLALRVEPPSFDTAHPGWLIIDEPQQQMMRTEQYARIMQLLIRLATDHRDATQIIVAATNIEGLEDYLRPIETIRKRS